MLEFMTCLTERGVSRDLGAHSPIWNITLFRLFLRQISPPSVVLANLAPPPFFTGGALRRVHLNMPHDRVRDLRCSSSVHQP